jgi:hypothetical protein
VTTPAKTTEPAVPRTPDEYRALLKRAKAGDRAVVPALRKLLENPAEVEALGGNLARIAEDALVVALGGDDLALKMAIGAKLEALRKELLGPSPTPIERLLAERAVACWLHVQEAEVRYALNQKDMTLRQGDYHQRRMDAANRRYLAALKALALVRKLAVPALQVNIARKQVNIAGAGPVAEGNVS